MFESSPNLPDNRQEISAALPNFSKQLEAEISGANLKFISTASDLVSADSVNATILPHVHLAFDGPGPIHGDNPNGGSGPIHGPDPNGEQHPPPFNSDKK